MREQYIHSTQRKCTQTAHFIYEWVLYSCVPACWIVLPKSPRWSRRCSTLSPWWRDSSCVSWTTAPWWVKTAATTAWAVLSICWYVPHYASPFFVLFSLQTPLRPRFSNRIQYRTPSNMGYKLEDRRNDCVIVILSFILISYFLFPLLSLWLWLHLSSVLDLVCIPRICDCRHRPCDSCITLCSHETQQLAADLRYARTFKRTSVK